MIPSVVVTPRKPCRQLPVERQDLLDTETFAAECQGSDFMETFTVMGEYFCGGPMRGG